MRKRETNLHILPSPILLHKVSSILSDLLCEFWTSGEEGEDVEEIRVVVLKRDVVVVRDEDAARNGERRWGVRFGRGKGWEGEERRERERILLGVPLRERGR